MYDLRKIGLSKEATDDLFSLALGSSFPINSYIGCVINRVKWFTYAHDCRQKAQNSGVSIPDIEENTFYGCLEEILELSYILGIGCLYLNVSDLILIQRRRDYLHIRILLASSSTLNGTKITLLYLLPKPNKCSTLMIH